MEAELRNLQKIIRKKGWTEPYQNGPAQTGMRKSLEGDVYVSLVKNYHSVLKTLNDMLAEIPDNGDEFEKKFFK